MRRGLNGGARLAGQVEAQWGHWIPARSLRKGAPGRMLTLGGQPSGASGKARREKPGEGKGAG
jgi:hypothetical protein